MIVVEHDARFIGEVADQTITLEPIKSQENT